MPHGFHVYIDESGDEGFRFAAGSSDWFVLSAVVTRAENDIATVRLVDEVRKIINRPGKPLHFRHMDHEHRLVYVDRIGNARVRTVSVLIHKPSLQEPEKFQREPHRLYRYATRLLLERVSWLCRDMRKADHEHHTAQLIFSNRSAMSYDDLREYLGVLKSGSTSDVRVEWCMLDCAELLALPHHARMGLQIADAVASSMWCGVNRSRLGYVEPRYAQMLARVVYRHERVALGYGVKLFPKSARVLAGEFKELAWIEPTYEPRPAKGLG